MADLEREITQRLGVPETPTNIVPVVLYVHRDKHSNYSDFEELNEGLNCGMTDEQIAELRFTAGELRLDCTLDIKRGEVMCQKVEGVELVKPIRVS